MQAELYHVRKEPVAYFSLQDFLPAGQRLVLHRETRTLSLIEEGPRLLEQQVFSDKELRVILAILEVFPHYCPYEVLLACVTRPSTTELAIKQCRCYLQESHERGTWYQDMKPLRRVLSSLRPKLQAFRLEISTLRERGCSLTGPGLASDKDAARHTDDVLMRA